MELRLLRKTNIENPMTNRMTNKSRVELIEEILYTLVKFDDVLLPTLLGMWCLTCSLSCSSPPFSCSVIFLLVLFSLSSSISTCSCRMEECPLTCSTDAIKNHTKKKLITKIHPVKTVTLENPFDSMAKWPPINGPITKPRLEKALKLPNTLGWSTDGETSERYVFAILWLCLKIPGKIVTTNHVFFYWNHTTNTSLYPWFSPQPLWLQSIIYQSHHICITHL